MPVLTLVETAAKAEQAGEVAAVANSSRDLSKEQIQLEIDVILAKCQLVEQLEPDQVMILCSGMLARMTELYIRIQRVEHVRRELKSVRTQEIVQVMELIRDQYKIASRLITVRGLDVELSR